MRATTQARMKRAAWLVAACGACACAGVAHGHGMMPRDAPVERLIVNIGEQLKAHPDDAEWLYRLGRVHMLALERKSNFIPSWEHDLSRPVEGSWARDRGFSDDEKRPSATREELERHLAEAITSLNKAIALQPMEAKFRLTLACTLEAGAAYRTVSTPWPLPPVFADPAAAPVKHELDYARSLLRVSDKNEESKSRLLERARNGNTEFSRNRDYVVFVSQEVANDPAFADVVSEVKEAYWSAVMEEQFFAAMCFSLPADGKATEQQVWGGREDWVAYEAATDFVRVIEARTPHDSDQIRLKVAKATVKAFDELPPPGAITPLVISLDGAPLSRLVSNTTSHFNLDDSGLPQNWSWIGPGAGLLVWDPECTGRIESGNQLFGSVSWKVGFQNGYEALSCLDDSRDGELAGDELKGIAAWFDRNGNGVSDAGEVVTLSDLDIEAISTRVTGTADDGKSPTSAQGLRMRDGRTLPTFDWIAESIPQPHK